MDSRKKRRIAFGAALYRTGLTLEARRARLRRPAERGVGYDSPQMARALRKFQQASDQWTEPERGYLELR